MSAGRVARFLQSFFETDDDREGVLYQKEDGAIYVRQPGQGEQQVGGGGSLPDPLTAPLNVEVADPTSEVGLSVTGTGVGADNTDLADFNTPDGHGVFITGDGTLVVQIDTSAGSAVIVRDHAGATLLTVLASGDVVMPALPLSDPAAAGRLWNNFGLLMVSGYMHLWSAIAP